VDVRRNYKELVFGVVGSVKPWKRNVDGFRGAFTGCWHRNMMTFRETVAKLLPSATQSGSLLDEFWSGLAAMLVAVPSAIAFGVTVFAPLGGTYAAYGAVAGWHWGWWRLSSEVRIV